MSYCRKEGKDTIIFATEDVLSSPSTTQLQPDDPQDLDTSNAGAILPNGEINWDCPCLGNLPNGPCGSSFREAFSCWVENKDNEEAFADKCFENFTTWENCLGEHRDIYRQTDEKMSEADNELKEMDQNSDIKSISDKESTSNRAIAAASAVSADQ
uniref:GCK domain-containing protein n=1 Tax=Ciona savignyi TaxID=51511 RepID=H2Z7L2_CIOSA